MGLIKKARKTIDSIGMPTDAIKIVEELKKEEEKMFKKKRVKNTEEIREDPKYEEEEDEVLTDGTEEDEERVERPKQQVNLHEYLMFEPNFRTELIIQLGRIASALEKLDEEK